MPLRVLTTAVEKEEKCAGGHHAQVGHLPRLPLHLLQVLEDVLFVELQDCLAVALVLTVGSPQVVVALNRIRSGGFFQYSRGFLKKWIVLGDDNDTLPLHACVLVYILFVNASRVEASCSCSERS